MNLLFAVAVVAGLSSRPEGLTGPKPEDYSAWLASQALRADTGFAREKACEAVTFTSDGMSPMPERDLAKTKAMAAEAAGPVVIEHVRVVGCGRDWRQNIISYRTKAGEWRSSILLPGESRADYFQQREVLNMVLQIAPIGLSPVTCDSAQQTKTLFMGAAKVTAKPDASGVWKEVWPVKLCGQERPVEITYTPKAGGDVEMDYQPVWEARARKRR